MCSRSEKCSGSGWPMRACAHRAAGPGRSQDRASVCGGGCRLGLDRAGGEGQLRDEFIGQVVEAVRPHRVGGHGDAWRTLADHHDQITTWVKDDLTAVTIHELLGEAGTRRPLRTVQRYVAEACGRTRGQSPSWAQRAGRGHVKGRQRLRTADADRSSGVSRASQTPFHACLTSCRARRIYPLKAVAGRFEWGVPTILDRDSQLRGSVHVRATPEVQPAVQG
jgi:hypothetical protein